MRVFIRKIIKLIQKYIMYILWYLLPSTSIPNHIAIIMDGNRRFARKNKLDDVTLGHRAGFEKMIDVVRWCRDLGVKEATVYAFSLENFNRPQDEVDGLMQLAREKFEQMLSHRESLIRTGARIKIIGKISTLPQDLQDIVERVQNDSKRNNAFTLNICVAYLSTEEIVNSINQIHLANPTRRISEKDISENLYTSPSPEPCLVIRTSGERRLSSFLLWQACNSLLLFEKVYWPDFSFYQFLLVIEYYHFTHKST
ncbi:hypothetical protein LOD99_2450 [Oopsacas minuta]|uniref:Alkyl transferase n=1 Tax=Oopsacas minuta TaxID=111878 RepID=A0AAV7K1Z5_9METZ|nr:hypothetical protein LOD99_2450 [Oopsacas minuta]